MSRNARVVIPSVAHHVTQRGKNRLDVFFVDVDWEVDPAKWKGILRQEEDERLVQSLRPSTEEKGHRGYAASGSRDRPGPGVSQSSGRNKYDVPKGTKLSIIDRFRVAARPPV